MNSQTYYSGLPLLCYIVTLKMLVGATPCGGCPGRHGGPYIGDKLIFILLMVSRSGMGVYPEIDFRDCHPERSEGSYLLRFFTSFRK